MLIINHKEYFLPIIIIIVIIIIIIIIIALSYHHAYLTFYLYFFLVCVIWCTSYMFVCLCLLACFAVGTAPLKPVS
jgi:hypothetical protein